MDLIGVGLMESQDLAQYSGKPVQDVLLIAQQKAQHGMADIRDAADILKLCASQAIDRHSRGRILQQIWELEQSLGQHRLFMSQAGQDQYIFQRFFPTRLEGTFVEIGGFDGTTGSNCYFFEKVRGWTGLIVEASIAAAVHIRETRSAEHVNAVVGGTNGEAEFLEITSGLVQMGGLVETYPPEVLQRIRTNPDHQERIVEVRKMALNDLIQQHGLKRIDYCSIDVEGAERDVLEGCDFDSLDIKVISVENSSASESASFQGILEPYGYRLDNVIGFDEIYVHKSIEVRSSTN